MSTAVKTVTTEIPEVPNTIATGLNETVRPLAGGTIFESDTVPRKPLRLVAVIVELPEEPA